MTDPSNANALVVYEKPTDVVIEIMDQYVAPATKTMYTHHNLTFLLWLFDKDAELYMHDSILDDALTAHEDDEEQPSKGNKKRKALRTLFKNCLSKVDKGKRSCPIVLQKITFNVFSDYLAQRRSKKGAMLSKASYGGIVSAWMYLINKAGYKMPPEFQKDLTTFQRGMKRKVTSEKVKSGRSLEEGKKPMNFDVYKLMCKKLLQMEKDEGAFAHLFLILEWNLMARASNCLLLHLGHIEWRNDCLVFFFGKSKGDQTGENSNNPWHVYSNQ